MQIGDVNVPVGIMEAELRIGTLERIVDILMSKLSYSDKISQQQIDTIRKEVAKQLQTKYPNMGIQVQ